MISGTVGDSRPTSSDRADTAALRAILHVLFGPWGLGVHEAAMVLGGIPLRTLLEWRESPESASVDARLRRRISLLLALHKSLRAARPDRAAQRAWLREPGCSDRPPIALLMDGDTAAIRSLRRTLTAGAG